MNQRAVLTIGLLAYSLSLAACVSTSLPPLHDAKRPFALEGDEAALWEEARTRAATLDAERVADAQIESYLDRIVRRLLGSDLARLEATPRVRVLPGLEANAFTLPDGSIYLYSALLTTLANEDQVAAVLGHELTHFTHRHSVRTQRSATNDSMGANAASLAAAILLLNPQIALDVSDFWMVAAVAGYSRDLEREADDAGFARAVQAGYAAAELIAGFERLRDGAAAADHDVEAAPFYASHPAMNERVEHYRALASESPAPRSSPPDPRVHRNASAAAHVGNAWAHLLAWDTRAAASSLALYRELRPADAEGHFVEGWIAHVEGQPLDAVLARYRAAVEVDPTHVRAWRRIGLLERRRGRGPAAREALERALALDASAPDAAILELIARADEAPIPLPPSAQPFRGDGPRRVAVAPVHTTVGIELEPSTMRALEADVGDALRNRGYRVVDGSVYASLAESFEHSVRERLGTDRPAGPEHRSAIDLHVRNELFARYGAEAIMVPVIDAERARFEDGTMHCRGSAQPIPVDGNATQYDSDAGRYWKGFGPAISLRLLAQDDLGRALAVGASPCQPLAIIDTNGVVRDLPASQRLSHAGSRRDAAQQAAARIRAIAAEER